VCPFLASRPPWKRREPEQGRLTARFRGEANLFYMPGSQDSGWVGDLHLFKRVLTAVHRSDKCGRCVVSLAEMAIWKFSQTLCCADLPQ